MLRFALLALIPLTMLGCGGGLKEYSTAKVSGKVLCEGKPVGNVAVVFAPAVKTEKQVESGKSGFGSADADGAFTVSTYGQGDGAVVGKHTVIVMAPPPESFPDFNCACETNSKKVVQEVEVVAGGENNFAINLPVKANKKQSNFTKEQLQELKEEQAARN